ncbi:MAG: MBL fold metallo-hydrolase [Candidatus Coatesbacteria bacterium]|nr:MBL fold metallo-hydrolase [Candidatus Coatesbacteria bacterium]
MKFWTLGTSAAVATAERDNASILISAGEELFLIDCGGSPVHRMAKLGFCVSELTGVFVSHAHADHIFGLPAVIHARKIRCQGALPMRIFGPAKAMAAAHGILSALWDEETLRMYSNLISVPIEENYLLFESPSVHIFSTPVEHGPETLAVKFVERKTGISMAYSSDTRPCENLVRLAKGVDYLLHDSTSCMDGGSELKFGHSSAREAAVVARKAAVKRLILLHFAGYDVADCLREAAREFDGPIDAAHDLQEFSHEGSGDNRTSENI